MKIVKTQSLLMVQVIKYAEKLLGKALMRKISPFGHVTR